MTVIPEPGAPSDCIDVLGPLFLEEFAPLRPLLKTLGWNVGCCIEGENILRVIGGPRDYHCADELGAMSFVVSDALLYRPGGERLGVLGFLCGHSAPSATVVPVLEALLQHAARSISERWFRLDHREDWILAAAPVSNLDQGLLLALDQRMNLRGVGLGAPGTLGSGLQGTVSLQWEDFFWPLTPMPTMRGKADLPVRLRGVRDGQPWVALLSAPDVRAATGWSSDALLHARPRLHQLATVTVGKSEEDPNAPSLTTGMRRRIEDFIEARLDMPLPVEQLAQAAGMSCSHFTRAFRNVLKMTPHRYVMWRRLVKAQELIKSSQTSLAEIAVITGFADQSHLCRLFHQHLGESPSRYRRRWR